MEYRKDEETQIVYAITDMQGFNANHSDLKLVVSDYEEYSNQFSVRAQKFKDCLEACKTHADLEDMIKQYRKFDSELLDKIRDALRVTKATVGITMRDDLLLVFMRYF